MLNSILASFAKLPKFWLVFFCLFVYAPVQTHVVVLAQSSEKDGDKDGGKDDDGDDSGGDDNSGHGGDSSGSEDDSDDDNSGSGSDNSGGSDDNSGSDNSGGGNSGGGSDDDDSSNDNSGNDDSGNGGNSGNGNNGGNSGNGNSGNGNSGNGGNGNDDSDDDNDNDNQGNNGNSGSGNNNRNNDDKKDDEPKDDIQEDNSGKDDLDKNDRDDRLYYVGTVNASDGSSLIMDGAKLQSTSPWVEVLGTGMWVEAYGYWQGEDTFVADEVNVLAGDDWAYVQAPELLLGKSSGERQIEAWTRGETIDTQREASQSVNEDSVRVVAYFDGTKVRAVPKALTPPTSGLSAGWIEFTGRFDGDGIIWEDSRPFP